MIDFSLKLKPIDRCLFSAPIKGRSQCYASLHCEKYGYLGTWHITILYNAGKKLNRNRSCVVEFLFIWKTNNKSCQIIWRIKTSTCIGYILVVCVILSSLHVYHTLPASWLHRYLWKIWMQWSIALSSVFYRGREKHLLIVLSFNSQIILESVVNFLELKILILKPNWFISFNVSWQPMSD